MNKWPCKWVSQLCSYLCQTSTVQGAWLVPVIKGLLRGYKSLYAPTINVFILDLQWSPSLSCHSWDFFFYLAQTHKNEEIRIFQHHSYISHISLPNIWKVLSRSSLLDPTKGSFFFSQIPEDFVLLNLSLHQLQSVTILFYKLKKKKIGKKKGKKWKRKKTNKQKSPYVLNKVQMALDSSGFGKMAEDIAGVRERTEFAQLPVTSAHKMLLNKGRLRKKQPCPDWRGEEVIGLSFSIWALSRILDIGGKAFFWHCLCHPGQRAQP